MKSGKKLDLSLYLVLDANLCKTPEGMAETARKAVEGGCTVVQLRALEWKKKKQLRAAFLLKELLKDTDVLFIVDDHIDIALLSGADGVHVGQEDIDPKYVRQLLGPDAVIGLSVGSIKELNTIGPDVDYIGIGPVFSTKTKVDAGAAVGLGLLEYISKEAGLPNVAIGGINQSNAADCIRHGADGVAVVSAICGAEDPKAAAAAIKKAVNDALSI